MASSQEAMGSAAAEAARCSRCRTHESGVSKVDRAGSEAGLIESAKAIG